jgi:hypothetical protein
MDHQIVKVLWPARAVSCHGHLGLWDSHAQPDRSQARLQVIQLYSQGWEIISLHHVWRLSCPTVDAWIQRFETEHFAGLVARSQAPHAPARKVWRQPMVQAYHQRKAHLDAGRFRI